MEDLASKYAHIAGWGIDARKDKEKNAGQESVQQQPVSRPAQQVTEHEVLHSNERPYMTAVFGTSVPPSGVSGFLRRLAFRYSESKLQHWFLLIAADRLNVAEGLADDIRKCHFPNLMKERGWTARWKYDRPAIVKELAIKTMAVVFITAVFINRKRRKQHKKISCSN